MSLIVIVFTFVLAVILPLVIGCSVSYWLAVCAVFTVSMIIQVIFHFMTGRW